MASAEQAKALGHASQAALLFRLARLFARDHGLGAQGTQRISIPRKTGRPNSKPDGG